MSLIGMKEHVSGKLEDLSEPTLVRAIENNTFEIFRWAKRWLVNASAFLFKMRT